MLLATLEQFYLSGSESKALIADQTPRVKHPWNVDSIDLYVACMDNVPRQLTTADPILDSVTVKVTLGVNELYNRALNFDSTKSAFIPNPLLEFLSAPKLCNSGEQLRVDISSLAMGNANIYVRARIFGSPS